MAISRSALQGFFLYFIKPLYLLLEGGEANGLKQKTVLDISNTASNS